MPHLTVRKDDLELMKQHKDACMASGEICIRCVTANTRASVEFVGASLSPEQQRRLGEHRLRLVDGVVAIADSAAIGDLKGAVRYDVSPAFAEISGVLIERAPAAAEKLETLIRELVKEAPDGSGNGTSRNRDQS